ncbi:hypothetical protein [Clostridium massiliamazoniense]|uniref:hypothetical protein n=1 Tax=Clostridium massiliamazoniense TaxID=1347366 RepID=UPI0006D763E0|nr:hypothetical protein [Clostridium massiliamazoniense]
MELLIEGILFFKNTIIEKVYNFLITKKQGSFLHLIFLIGIIIFVVWTTSKDSFSHLNHLYFTFYFISAIISDYETSIRRVKGRLKTNSKIANFTLNKLFDKILSYNSQFFADKLLFAYPVALMFKVLHIVYIYHAPICYGDSSYNMYMVDHNHLVATIASNFNFSVAMYFGIYVVLGLLRKCIFSLLRNLTYDFKSNMIKKNLIICGIYLFFTLFIATLFGSVVESMVSNNNILILKYIGGFIVVFSIFYCFILPYIYDNCSYTLKEQ